MIDGSDADALGGSSSNDTLSSGGFFSSMFSGISDFFGGLFSGSSSGSTSQFMPRNGGYTRTSTVTPSSIEGIIGQALEKQADSIVEKIIAKNKTFVTSAWIRFLLYKKACYGPNSLTIFSWRC